MKLDEAKYNFIQSWGSLGSKWGINRAMAQIHAYLLIEEEPVATDDIMEKLKMSRGSVNMNIRTLMDWNLVYKVLKQGDRKEFFQAEKDIWIVTRRVIKIRRERELEPMLKALDALKNIDDDSSEDARSFIGQIDSIRKFAAQADRTLEIVMRSEENWFWNSFMKLVKK